MLHRFRITTATKIGACAALAGAGVHQHDNSIKKARRGSHFGIFEAAQGTPKSQNLRLVQGDPVCAVVDGCIDWPSMDSEPGAWAARARVAR